MPDSRARLWFASFVLVVFCLGGILGFGLGRRLPGPPPDGPGFPGGRGGPGPGRGGPLGFGRGPGGPPPLPPDLINRLSTEVQLDPAQQEQVKKILAERRDRLDSVHREARERFDKERAALLLAIRAVLRTDQQARFDAFLDRRR